MTISMKSNVKIDYLHVRMARAGLGLTVRELASLSGTNKATIVRLESGKSVRESTLALIQKILESKGVGFLPCDKTQKVGVIIWDDNLVEKPKENTE